MCGITGYISPTRDDRADVVLDRMTDTLVHRGPDGRGTWHDPAGQVHLGHRRLAIIDLSRHGAQPMVSHDGRSVIVYNGETYNFTALRDRLAALGVGFRGQSDTEALLAGLSQWGITATLEQMTGMFALAVWDTRDRTLTLARDRLGEKPLYYGRMGETFLFGSELKALAAHPAFRRDIDREALRQYLRLGYVPGPRSIWEGIHKLPPGSLLVVKDGPGPDGPPVPYWSAADVALEGRKHADARNEEAQIDDLERLLRRTIRAAMVSDVPLGVFLSGGIDSSLVAALAQAESPRPVRTFTIGFDNATYNEAEHAKRIARHLGTDHTEFYLGPEAAMATIQDLPRLYDEPFSDSSQIPTHLVSRLARSQVTVALSGDGGDELFGGYNRHVLAAPLWRRARRLPRPIRSLIASAVLALSPRAWDRLFRLASPFLSSRSRDRIRSGTAGEKAHKAARILRLADVDSFYERITSVWPDPDALLPRPASASSRPDEALGPPASMGGRDAATERMMLLDTLRYLPDDILVKVDRAAMGASLETRAPLLSHEVFAAAWRLPMGLKVNDGKGKIALRRVLARHVPEELFERPKTGFGLPIGEWLRGPLRPWAEDLLSEERIAADGLLRPGPIRAALHDHLTGRHDRHHELWNILMFQIWLDAQRDLPDPSLQTSVAPVIA